MYAELTKKNDKYILVNNPYIQDWGIENKCRIAGILLSDECIAYKAKIDNYNPAGFICLGRELRNRYYDTAYSSGCRGLQKTRNRQRII